MARGTIIVNGRTINVFSTHVSYASAYGSEDANHSGEELGSVVVRKSHCHGRFQHQPRVERLLHHGDAVSRFMGGGGQERHLLVADRNQGSTRGGSRFDYIYESRGATSLKLLKAWVVNSSASDHMPLVASFALQ